MSMKYIYEIYLNIDVLFVIKSFGFTKGSGDFKHILTKPEYVQHI